MEKCITLKNIYKENDKGKIKISIKMMYVNNLRELLKNGNNQL